MHTIRVGGRTPDAFTAPAGNDAETDSKAGKAKVAKEDFKKRVCSYQLVGVINWG